MIQVKGKYNEAKIFSDRGDDKAIGQIIELLNQDFTIDAKVRIMPDFHYGTGCVIGFTADLGKKVVPNLVGVDISCGMLVVELGRIENLDRVKLDQVVHDYIPVGSEVHNGRVARLDKISELKCSWDIKDGGRIERAIGTLGSGNHFIELDKDKDDNYYLVIHSGSRNLGKQVAEIYQKLAIESCKGLGDLNVLKQEIIKSLKGTENKWQIQPKIKELERTFNNTHPNYPEDLCFLEGQSREEYLHDVKICQEYATLNRYTMAKLIIQQTFGKDVEEFRRFESIHNYIDFRDNIIRKGAVSAYAGERLIIPINMRDGAIIGIGKGNPDWNNSAPHGAGRLMGRNEAKKNLDMEVYTQSMEGIYSTTVTLGTLDEAPQAYKPMQEIIDNIQDSVTIENIIKPVYNFKGEDKRHK
jgi:tRNA-splicing ligase RtcB (3'-phosphate/5'-hydroxy nucleic acid ligase)